MASALNTEPSLTKKTFVTLDHCVQASPAESSDGTYSQNIPSPSCSYAQPCLPNDSPSRPSVQKRLSRESLDDKLRTLLNQKLIGMVLRGRPSETIQYHRMKLIRELADWIEPSSGMPDTYDEQYRNQLLTLLATTSKQGVTDMPLKNSEWITLLNQWIRLNSSEDIIFERKIFQILAVDGFRGFGPKDLKRYLAEILLPLRIEYRAHVQGIRAMYEFLDDEIECLTGTDSACVIFLALLNLYLRQLELSDDQMFFKVQQTKSWAEGYLHSHMDYYKDLKNVNEGILRTLGNVYTEQFKDNEEWEIIGKELIRSFKML